MTERLPSATEARTEKTADGSLTLGWDASSVTYRSRYGAWTEANHVFVEGAAALHTLSHTFSSLGLVQQPTYLRHSQRCWIRPRRRI